jgi:retinol dehydrogenase-14
MKDDLMEGKIVLVTGSTDGIGKETALGIARMEALVLLHGRNAEKGRRVTEEIREKSGNDSIEFFLADLSLQRKVRRLAAEVEEEHDRLDVLVNNAGVFMKVRRLTADAIETTFAVNHLAPFLLTNLLLGHLKKSAPSRIATVSSIAHRDAQVDSSNLQGERRFDGFEAYATSKLGNLLFTYELSRRLKGSGVDANALHPGVVRTKLLRAGFGDYPGDDPRKGAETSIRLATSPELEGTSGLYFERLQQVASSPLSRDRALQKRFWAVSERLVGLG